MLRKRLLTALFAVFVVCGALGVITACTEKHEHIYSEEWSKDATYHWHAATCEHKDKVKDKAEHSFGGGLKCSVCNYEKQPDGNVLVEDTSYAVVTLNYGDTRVQLLSNALVRIEDKSKGKFEDRESYVISNHDDWGVKIEYETKKTQIGYEIITEYYTVVIPENSKAQGVYITDGDGEKIYTYLGTTGTNVYLPSPSDELSSWYFTDSPRVIPSEYGYSVSDDPAPLQGWEFDYDVTDVYVFLPHGNYKTFTTDFVSLTGQPEMLVLKMFGFWESRYHAYTAEEALNTIKTYQEKGYSIDVFTVDTDWRVGGGVGYEINEELFPDMKAFLEEAHSLGVNIFFNDHAKPVDGTHNLLDKEEVEYRNNNLVLLLSLGVDYWYYDRNWGVQLNQIVPEYSRFVSGMYAFTWITREYYDNLAKNGEVEEYARRTMLQANVDGCFNGSYVYASDLTAHRYSIQWTGDTNTDANWLQQEIEGAVMAGAEMGLPYVSSDLGGHKEQKSSNQYIRWMQYGALSSVMRTQCTNTEAGRYPWLYGDTAEEVVHTYQDMRYRLLPLYYATSYESYKTGVPIMRRLDIAYPQYVEAKSNDEYLLGDYILVAPISKSSGNDSREVFLPDGTWIDVWTGTRYEGPQTVTVTHNIKSSPIFVREGALVALARNMKNVDEKDWSDLTLDVYPSANYTAKTVLYEDDTKTVAYKDNKFRTTDIAMSCTGNTLKINIGSAQGSFKGERAFADRTWNLRLHKNPGWGAVKSVKVNGQTVTAETLAQITYNAGGRPFAYAGGALDGEINTFSLNTKVAEAYEIEIEYESVVNSANNAAYDATAVKFKASASKTDEESVNLTELGTTDWISYGYNSGTSIDYRKGGLRLFSAPEDSRPMYNSLCSVYSANLIKTGLEKSYTDGYRKSSNTVKGGTKNSVGYEFSVKTTGKKESVVLYIGGSNCVSKLTVRDRAGNVKTLMLGGKDVPDYTYKIEIEVEEGTASTLYMTYSPVTTTMLNERETSSSITLYCGYVSSKES